MSLIYSGVDYIDNSEEEWTKELANKNLYIPLEILNTVYKCMPELSLTASDNGSVVANLLINEYDNFISNSYQALRKYQNNQNKNIKLYLQMIKQYRDYGLKLRKELKEKDIVAIAHISGLMVTPEHRKKGLAQVLIKMMKDKLIQEQFQAIIFETDNETIKILARKLRAVELVVFSYPELNLQNSIWIYYIQ